MPIFACLLVDPTSLVSAVLAIAINCNSIGLFSRMDLLESPKSMSRNHARFVDGIACWIISLNGSYQMPG